MLEVSVVGARGLTQVQQVLDNTAFPIVFRMTCSPPVIVITYVYSIRTYLSGKSKRQLRLVSANSM
jgi:hypothetical protein